jgi:hypothetical protein
MVNVTPHFGTSNHNSEVPHRVKINNAMPQREDKPVLTNTLLKKLAGLDIQARFFGEALQ